MKILETNYEIKNSSVIQDKLVALQTELTALSTTVTNNNSNLQSLISSVNSSITSILNDLDQKATSIQTLSVNLQSLISSISELVESDAIKTNSVISDYGEIGELHSNQIYTNELETTDLTATNLESTDATITNIYATTLELSNFIISTISAATVSTNSLIAGQGAITEISSTKAILSKVITDKIIGKTLRTPIGTPDNTQLLKISIGEFNGTFTISTEQNEFSITVSENNLVTFIQSNFYIYRIDWNKQNSNLQIYLMNVSDSITYNAISLGSFSNLQIDSELVMRSEIKNNISTIGTGLLMRTNPISEAQEKIVQVVVYNSKSEMQEIGIENTIYVVKKDRSYFWNETSQEYVPMSEYTIEYVDELPTNPTNKFYGIPHSYNLETTESKTPIDLVGSYFTLHSTGKYVLKNNFTLTYNNNPVGSIYINNFDVSLYANKDFSGLYATTLNSRTVYTWKVTETVNHTDYYASENGTFTKLANAQQVEDLFIKNTEKGTAGGVATLGADGKIPIEQMNVKSLKFIGVYDCSSGVFPSTLGRESGDYYRVSVAGTLTELRDDIVIKAGFGLSSFEVNLINSAITSGLEVFTDISEVKTQVLSVSTTSIQCESVNIPLPQSSNIRLYTDSEFPFSWEFDVGDFILFNENNEWQKMSNQDSVTSVNNLSGDVVLNGDNISATLDGETKSINSIFSGLFEWIKGKLKDIFVTTTQLNESLANYTKMYTYTATADNLTEIKNCLQSKYLLLPETTQAIFKIIAGDNIYFAEIYKTNNNFGTGEIKDYNRTYERVFFINNGTFYYEENVLKNDITNSVTVNITDGLSARKNLNICTISFRAYAPVNIGEEGTISSIIPSGYIPINSVWGEGLLYKDSACYPCHIDIDRYGNLHISWQSTINNRSFLTKINIDNGYSIYASLTYVI